MPPTLVAVGGAGESKEADVTINADADRTTFGDSLTSTNKAVEHILTDGQLRRVPALARFAIAKLDTHIGNYHINGNAQSWGGVANDITAYMDWNAARMGLDASNSLSGAQAMLRQFAGDIFGLDVSSGAVGAEERSIVTGSGVEFSKADVASVKSAMTRTAVQLVDASSEGKMSSTEVFISDGVEKSEMSKSSVRAGDIASNYFLGSKSEISLYDGGSLRSGLSQTALTVDGNVFTGTELLDAVGDSHGDTEYYNDTNTNDSSSMTADLHTLIANNAHPHHKQYKLGTGSIIIPPGVRRVYIDSSVTFDPDSCVAVDSESKEDFIDIYNYNNAVWPALGEVANFKSQFDTNTTVYPVDLPASGGDFCVHVRLIRNPFTPGWAAAGDALNAPVVGSAAP